MVCTVALVDEFLTAAEVAELPKLNPQTVRNHIDRGLLPAVGVGPRRVRIRRADRDQILAKGSSGGQAEAPGRERLGR